MPPDIKDLQFVRAMHPNTFKIIPRELFEQIKELDEEAIDAIYANAESIMSIPVVNEKGVKVGTLPKVNVWIALLYDITHNTQGLLWCEFDFIERRIFVQACSLDKEYQSKDGAFIKKVVEYIRTLPVAEKLKGNIQFATLRPKAFERLGFKRSLKVLMQYEEGKKQNG